MLTRLTRIGLAVVIVFALDKDANAATCRGAIGGCPQDTPCTEEIDGVEYCTSCCIAGTAAPTKNTNKVGEPRIQPDEFMRETPTTTDGVTILYRPGTCTVQRAAREGARDLSADRR